MCDFVTVAARKLRVHSVDELILTNTRLQLQLRMVLLESRLLALDFARHFDERAHNFPTASRRRPP